MMHRNAIKITKEARGSSLNAILSFAGVPERRKFASFKERQTRKLGKDLELTDYNDLMNYIAKPGVTLPDTLEDCEERRM